MADWIPLHPEHPEPEPVAQIARRLQAGGVFAIPTDTIYGLSANPLHVPAVERIYEMKGRNAAKALPLLVPSLEWARELSRDLPPLFLTLAQVFWPGPLTLIVKAAPELPRKVTAGSGSVALRWPRAPIALALMQAAGMPLTATSANRSGWPECGTPEEVEHQLGGQLDGIVAGGPSPARRSSTLLDLTRHPAVVVREGVIARAVLAPYLAS